MFKINNNFVPTAFGWGGCHYNTLDNVHVGKRFGNRRNWYNFQGGGQFVLLRIVDQGSIHVFELQGEARQPSPCSRVTVHRRLAFGVPSGASFQVLTFLYRYSFKIIFQCPILSLEKGSRYGKLQVLKWEGL